ncbi:MAG: TolC family outer membrane protein [Gammaproteobacteria bacterium]
MLLRLFIGIGVYFASTCFSNVYAQTLKEAVQQVLDSNPTIQSSTAERRAVEEEISQARAGYFPTVDLAAGYGHELSNNNVTRQNNEGDLDLWRSEASIFARQMIFDGFETPNEVRRHKSRTDSRAYTVFGQSELQGLEAARAYLDVLRRQELVQLAEENLEIHKRVNGQIKLRSERGIGRKADTDQAQGRLDLAEKNYLSEAGNYEDARTAFLKVIGTLPGNLEQPAKPAEVLPDNLDDATEIAVDNHPVLRSANADINNSLAQYETAKAPFYPRVDLEAGASYNYNLDGVKGKNEDAWAMLRVRYNIFRGGKDLARHRETAHLISQAKEIRDNTYRQVVESMRLSWVAYKTVESQMDFFKGHAENSIKTNKAYQQQFNIGQRTLLDLLDSANEMFVAKTNLVNARYDSLFSQYRILTSMGSLNKYLQTTLPEESTPYTDGTQEYPWIRKVINNETLRMNLF